MIPREGILKFGQLKYLYYILLELAASISNNRVCKPIFVIILIKSHRQVTASSTLPVFIQMLGK